VNHCLSFSSSTAYNCEILRAIRANARYSSGAAATTLQPISWCGGTIETRNTGASGGGVLDLAPTRCAAPLLSARDRNDVQSEKCCCSGTSLHTRFLAMSDRTLTGRPNAHPADGRAGALSSRARHAAGWLTHLVDDAYAAAKRASRKYGALFRRTPQSHFVYRFLVPWVTAHLAPVVPEAHR